MFSQEKKKRKLSSNDEGGFQHLNSSVTPISSNANKACAGSTPAARPQPPALLVLFSLWVLPAVLREHENVGWGKTPSPRKLFPGGGEGHPASLSIYSMSQGNSAQLCQDCPLKEGRRKARAKLCSWQIRVFNKSNMCKKLNRSTQVSRIIVFRMLTFYLCSYPTQCWNLN